MKKKAIGLLVVALLVQLEAPVQAAASAAAASIATEKKVEQASGIFKKKRKGYRAKKGGLFGTGLFRKKSPCGCPNH
ncbi:hypothetical protein GCM10023189_08540 [Nibrella saemangeumensis]|uniref:Uncharacterized protein n=1 Tax=Nibrella saemangeumensis TaxID=1084526 RepID=A0ABP8MGX6_9BACT